MSARWTFWPALLPAQAACPESAREPAARHARAARLNGGELNAAITSALIAIQTRYLGRGPSTASTFHKDNVIVTLLHNVMTHAEQSLAAAGNSDAVTHMHHLFQTTMENDFREAIERLTDRKVIAFISGNNINPDIASELFILDNAI